MMNALFVTVVCTVLVVCQAGTTTKQPHVHHTHDPSHTHPTREPSEHETFLFSYDPFTHHLVLLAGHKCYVDTTLTTDQLLAVHSDTGMRDLEYKVLQQLSTFTATTRDQINTHDAHHCRHATDFYKL